MVEKGGSLVVWVYSKEWFVGMNLVFYDWVVCFCL